MRKKPDHNIKAWSPTRRQLMEELGTDTDRALAMKYSLSAGRVRQLRLEQGIASYTENKKRTPMSELEERVAILEDEMIRLRAFSKGEASRAEIRARRVISHSQEWIDQAPKLLGMKEDLTALILIEINKRTNDLTSIVERAVSRKVNQVRREYEENNRAMGQKLFELPGYMYQELYREEK